MATIHGKQKASQANLVGKTLCNDEYYIHRIIGHGGMGKVYLAAHTELTVPVALKQARADQPLPDSVAAELDALLQGERPSSEVPLQEVESSGGEHTDRFFREALFLARLHHPALPSLYDYFFEDGYWYMVMDYIPGPTLTMYLRQQGPLPPLEAINFALQLCDVFDYLHKQTPPIVYRDLKPSNILVTPGGKLMLVDFGIARYFKEGQSNDTTDFGSPGYASPEQYQMEGQTDGRSDLYSLGILLYEMLSGQRPNASNGISADGTKDIPPLSTVLNGLITLATRTEPMYRFQSAHTFFLALERAYAIEEQRTYQQRVIQEQVLGSSHEDYATISLNHAEEGHDELPPIDAEERQEEVLPVPEAPLINPLEPVQRQKIREVLQQMRRERVEDAELETDFDTVDEKLEERASMKLLQYTHPLASDSDQTLEVVGVKQPFRFPVQRIIRTSFVIVLVVFLLLASLLFVVRTFHSIPLLSQRPHIVPTIAPPPSAPTATPSPTSVKGAWQPLPSQPSIQADNTAAYVQVQGRSYIYVNGGYRGAKESPHYDRHLYRYDITAAQWEETSANSQFPGMVNNSVAVDASHRLFYSVGYSTTSYSVTSLLLMYQPANNTVQKIVPPPQVTLGFGNSMTSDTQGHLYITQGFTHTGTSQRAGTGWYRYDIATGQWHVLAPLPQGLGYVVLAATSDRTIVLIGGATDTSQHTQTNTIYTYDTRSNTWQQSPTTAPVALSGTASCLARPGQLVIIGGYDTAQNKGLASAWLVDLSTMKWTSLAQLPTGNSVLGAAASDGQGHVYLTRGASDPAQPTSDFWELTV